MSFYARSRHAAALPARKKRKRQPAIEEINFDDNAREAYLTGFHKRKQARIKHAQENAKKREREEKIEARRALREQRKKELNEKMRAIKKAEESQKSLDGDSEYGDEEDAMVGNEITEAKLRLDRKDEYVDEDKFAVVTVEEVDVSKEGIQRVQDGDGDGEERRKAELETTSKQPRVESARTRKDEARADVPRKKKRRRKIRYENKAERSANKKKQKLMRKTKAIKRREE